VTGSWLLSEDGPHGNPALNMKKQFFAFPQTKVPYCFLDGIYALEN
jgi:hypothetical protein